jgi:UDP-N-acetylglucosamine 4,6-dehydratase/5-epimerase
MFDGKKVLITGGTGSLGNALTKKILKTNVDTIRIFSRDELKQVQMDSQLNDKRLRFLIGDVRDKERLMWALEDIDIVIHAAALKHVPVVEYNPFEAVKTNVNGTQNLIEACLKNNVEKAIAIGTDKAVAPLNTYGTTKLLMERLFVSANYYKGNHKTNFMCVRYGNVLASRGSIVPRFIQQIENNQNVTVTDPSMTRFNITMNEALDLILRALENGVGGEIFIPKLKAYKVGDMKEAIIQLMNKKTETDIIQVRPGEKYHESLISEHEIRNTFETKTDYIIYESDYLQCSAKNTDLKQSKLTDRYSSDNVELLSIDELKNILIDENIIQK